MANHSTLNEKSNPTMYGPGGGMRGYGRGGGGARAGGARGGGGDRYGRRRYEDGPRGGAEHLARIHGTEEDKVNCPFYFKIGACRHGERCTRQHHKPPFSQTLLLSHMYQNPAGAIIATGGTMAAIDTAKAQDEFEDFYEEVYEELSKFGTIEEMHVCDNLGDHLVGNVYAKFSDEEEADAALKGLYGRWYSGRPIVCEFSPVTDFREARCRQYDEATCGRGGQCNFMHVRYLSSSVVRWCERQAIRSRREREHSESSDRSRSPSREKSRRGRSRSRERTGDRRRRARSDSRDRDRDRRDYKRSRRERRDRSDDERGSPDRRRTRRDTSDDERGTHDRRRRRDGHREHENTHVRSEDRDQSRDRLNQEGGPTREVNGMDDTRNGVSGDASP